MMKITTTILTAFLTFGICSAQTPSAQTPSAQTKEAAPAKFFRLDFIVKELDEGRVMNARSYSTLMSTDTRGAKPSLRTGSKVPVKSGAGDQFTYVDVGINFDCRFIEEVGNSLALDVTSEVSSSPASETEGSAHLPPVIRQNRWSSSVVIPVGKPTTIFSSDDLTSKHKIQVELTATRIAP